MRTEGIDTEALLETIIRYGLRKAREKYGSKLDDSLIALFLTKEIRSLVNIGIKPHKKADIFKLQAEDKVASAPSYQAKKQK